MDLERLITLKAAADQFGLSYSHLRLLARTGRLAARKLGREWVTTPVGRQLELPATISRIAG